MVVRTGNGFGTANETEVVRDCEAAVSYEEADDRVEEVEVVEEDKNYVAENETYPAGGEAGDEPWIEDTSEEVSFHHLH